IERPSLRSTIKLSSVTTRLCARTSATKVLIPIHWQLADSTIAPRFPRGSSSRRALAIPQAGHMKLTAMLPGLPEVVLDLLVHPAFGRRVHSDGQPHCPVRSDSRSTLKKVS